MNFTELRNELAQRGFSEPKGTQMPEKDAKKKEPVIGLPDNHAHEPGDGARSVFVFGSEERLLTQDEWFRIQKIAAQGIQNSY